MNYVGTSSAPCVVLTGTIKVADDICKTARKDLSTRLSDYTTAFKKWLMKPGVGSLVFVENSGYDLSEFQSLADAFPEKRVELLSFSCPPFDGSFGKGYGEMFCLKYCLDHSTILKQSSHLFKVTGRYDVANADELIRYISDHPETDVFCTLRRNLTWADSRAFGSRVDFLRDYLCPMHNQINDSKLSEFERVLARAIHEAMADGGTWSMWPQDVEILGVCGGDNLTWTPGPVKRIKGKIRHKLLAEMLAR